MNDALKNFINQNRKAFDDRETPAGAWQKIDASVPQMKDRSLWNSLVAWRVAAIVLLGLSLYLMIVRNTLPAKKEIAQSQGDFSDLESFYRNQIAEKVRLIHDFDATGDSDQFTQDFQKLDAMYLVLGDEMKNHPGKKVKDAMILNLLVRIDLLNQQLKKLEDSRKKKQEDKAA